MCYPIELSKTSSSPLYIQLAQCLANLIQNQTIKHGSKLPAIRYLSKQLSINPDTVTRAYELLKQQGLAQAYVGKGTYATFSPCSSNLLERIYCSHTNFSTSSFLTSTCLQMAHGILEQEKWDAFSDLEDKVKICLKNTIKDFLSTLKIFVSINQIRLITHLEAYLKQLFLLSCKTGICVEQYRDLALSNYFQTLGAKIYEIPVTPNGMNLNILEKQLKSGNISYIIVSPYLQNPTGICYTTENKHQLLYLAQKYDCYIIEDGTWSIFHPRVHTLAPLFTLCSNQRVIYYYHFSKLFFPPLHYSFWVLPNKLSLTCTDTLSCSFNEKLFYTYLSSKEFTTSKQSLLTNSQKHYDKTLAALQNFTHSLPVYATCGGLWFWIKPLTHSTFDLCKYLLKNNIVVSPSSIFTFSKDNTYIRLSISSLSETEIDFLIHILQTQTK